MKKITILTLFKPLYEDWLKHSIIQNAIKGNKVEIEIIDFRDYANNKHRQVDDYGYGGGPGMVLMIEPIARAIKALKKEDSIVILTTPKGVVYNQTLANQFSNNYNNIILIAGHYEGFDERINNYIDIQISIGDFVLTGGELPTMVIADSIIRLIDGVISSQSLESESFNNHLLDFPVYTRPSEYDGHKVPEVLLSGNHQKIAAYRLEQQEIITKNQRPDLYEKYLKNKK